MSRRRRWRGAASTRARGERDYRRQRCRRVSGLERLVPKGGRARVVAPARARVGKRGPELGSGVGNTLDGQRRQRAAAHDARRRRADAERRRARVCGQARSQSDPRPAASGSWSRPSAGARARRARRLQRGHRRQGHVRAPDPGAARRAPVADVRVARRVAGRYVQNFGQKLLSGVARFRLWGSGQGRLATQCKAGYGYHLHGGGAATAARPGRRQMTSHHGGVPLGGGATDRRRQPTAPIPM